MFHFSAGKNNLPKHQRCMRSFSCIHTHSTHTHTHTHARNHTHISICVLKCVQANSLTHALSVFTLICWHTHTHTPSLNHSKAEVNSRVLPDGVCNVRDYCFGVFDLWCCPTCVSACVFVFAYMCGRLVLPCFFECVFYVCNCWTAPQTTGQRPCLPRGFDFVKKKKHPVKH